MVIDKFIFYIDKALRNYKYYPDLLVRCLCSPLNSKPMLVYFLGQVDETGSVSRHPAVSATLSLADISALSSASQGFNA